jgi:hypothetical protein
MELQILPPAGAVTLSSFQADRILVGITRAINLERQETLPGGLP